MPARYPSCDSSSMASPRFPQTMIERIITAFAVASFENMVDLRDRTNSTVGADASRDRLGSMLLKSMSVVAMATRRRMLL